MQHAPNCECQMRGGAIHVCQQCEYEHQHFHQHHGRNHLTIMQEISDYFFNERIYGSVSLITEGYGHRIQARFNIIKEYVLECDLGKNELENIYKAEELRHRVIAGCTGILARRENTGIKDDDLRRLIDAALDADHTAKRRQTLPARSFKVPAATIST